MTMRSERVRYLLSWSSPSWRWSRASYLVSKRSWEDRLLVDDDWTKLCIRHLWYAGEGTSKRMLKRWPMLSAVPGAIAIAEGPEFDRLAIEARLLALQPLDHIASQAGRQPKEIEAFEQLFFDFRERHDSAFWIDARIIRSHIYIHRPQTLRTAVLRLAFHGGPAVADQVLATVQQYVGRNHKWDTVTKAAGEGAPEVDRLTLLALATMMAPWTAEAQAKLARQYRKLQRDLGRFDQESQPVAAEVHDFAPQAPVWERLRDEIEAAYASPTVPAASTGVA